MADFHAHVVGAAFAYCTDVAVYTWDAAAVRNAHVGGRTLAG